MEGAVGIWHEKRVTCSQPRGPFHSHHSSMEVQHRSQSHTGIHSLIFARSLNAGKCNDSGSNFISPHPGRQAVTSALLHGDGSEAAAGLSRWLRNAAPLDHGGQSVGMITKCSGANSCCQHLGMPSESLWPGVSARCQSRCRFSLFHSSRLPNRFSCLRSLLLSLLARCSGSPL